MKVCSTFSLQELLKGHPSAEYRRRLVANGKPLPVIVNGDEIGYQGSNGRYSVVATSYDYFDGCEHWIYLLGPDYSPIDQLKMPDEFGFIQDVIMISDQELSFGYFGTNDRWNLQVSETGFWSYAPTEFMRRPNRFFLAKRHLKVWRTKGAPWSFQEKSNSSLDSDVPLERRST